jgi:hypothetical protein
VKKSDLLGRHFIIQQTSYNNNDNDMEQSAINADGTPKSAIQQEVPLLDIVTFMSSSYHFCDAIWHS